MAEAADVLVNNDWDFIDEADMEAARSFVEISKSLSIIVIGKPGIGKSSLVRSLLDHDLPAEKKPIVKSGMLPVTTKTEVYTIPLGDVSVMVYDTKGMFDVDDETIRKVEEVCNNDCTGNGVLLICFEMHTRIDMPAVQRMLALLHQKYGRKIWEVTVIALTKADQYPKREWLQKWYQKLSPEKYLKAKFGEALECDRQVIQSLFTSAKVGMSREEFDKLKIPILPTSHLTTEAMVKMEKVGYESWFDTLLETCCTRERGAAFVKINSKRLSTKCTKAACVAVGTVSGAGIGATVGVPLLLIPFVGEVVGVTSGTLAGGTIAAIVTHKMYCYLRRRQRKKDPRFESGMTVK